MMDDRTDMERFRRLRGRKHDGRTHYPESDGCERLHWLTSKMSHDHSRRDSCRLRFRIRLLHSIILSLARGMTAVVVGSGAWLGVLDSDLQTREMDMGFWELLSHAARSNRATR